MRIQEIIQEYGAADIRTRSRTQSYDYAAMKRAQHRANPDFDPEDETNSEFIPDKGTGPKPKTGPRPERNQGWYSGGQTNPRDPHEFVKKPHLTTLLDKDAYYTFVKEITALKTAGYHNPFFPQIYNVDITQDPKGNQRPRYRIEKLQNGEDYSEEALLGMYERLFLDEPKLEKSWSNPVAGIWYLIASEVNGATARENYSNIRSKQLKAALMLIAKILSEHPDWNVDLHGNNIRVRGSGTGPQLVLMDPISDGGTSIPDPEQVQYGPDRKFKPKPKYDADKSTFANWALNNAEKPDPNKKTGLGTMLKRKLDQKP